MDTLEQPAWSSIDDNSLTLIVSILSDDASNARSTAKGKQPERALSDAELALQLYTDELHRAAVYVSDRRMTRSVQGTVQTDTDILIESEWHENVARHDREMAAAQSAGRPHTHTELPANTGLSENDRETWGKLASKYINGDNGSGSDDSFNGSTSTESDVQPGSSTWAASRLQISLRHGSCIACTERKSLEDLNQAPCEHYYCGECLEHLFRAAISDESLFPPRCCRLDIPVPITRPFLPNELINQFFEKSIESMTPNKTYCHQSACSAFIPPWKIKNRVATCIKCENMTCETCKGVLHGGDCPSDTGLQQVLEMAREALVNVEPSSATCAQHDGKPVDATIGTRPGSTIEHRKSTIGATTRPAPDPNREAVIEQIMDHLE
ncbi:hypothetical protein NPX13_g11156 [Xylaria arbuscula]|uniref:IBR domain-containing protein n=1 Tax=Xylaria arbuscula TaxID=114810 RepID=A0A9W8N373_9PEZI|nr:hypothetical protein NPX13_g11156 [Xylaria arbuscula]